MIMKVCKYCGSTNDYSSDSCPSCGGNQFNNKCNNCGTIYEKGNFCPNCGVKAGTKPKVCPRCGKEYFSHACPDCGYTAGKAEETYVFIPAQAEPVSQKTAPQPVVVPYEKPKSNKTWLWVLGWIFVFPVPLTILMLKNKKLPKALRIAIIALGWIVYLLFALLGALTDDTTTNHSAASPPAAISCSEFLV